MIHSTHPDSGPALAPATQSDVSLKENNCAEVANGFSTITA